MKKARLLSSATDIDTEQECAPGLSSNGPDPQQFLSWISITILVLLFLFFRSVAGPYFRRDEDSRNNRSGDTSKFYFNLMFTIYIWLASASFLTIFPHIGGEGNAIATAALFFPMFFATLSAILIGRFAVRTLYYFSMTTRIVEKAGVEAWKNKIRHSPDSGSTSKNDMPSTNGGFRETIHSKMPQLKLVAFQRPFRKLVKISAGVSAVLCFLYAHCWSSKLSAFKVARSDGAGAMCRAIFSPLAFGGLSKENMMSGLDDGADEMCLWFVWATCCLANIIIFAQDEFAGKHRITDDETEVGDEIVDEDSAEDKIQTPPSPRAGRLKKRLPFINMDTDGPQDTLPMVPWYSVVLIYSVFDLLVAFKVFLGRYDARTMQPALHKREKKDQKESEPKDTRRKSWDRLKSDYSGCLFDMSNRGKWFDFAADTGDGFDSTYQVARMLAQPTITVINDGKEETLPRGQFMVIGGDLAYPDPEPATYEHRFFRPFEDAMQPPPCFRRRAISTRKPALPVKSWKDSDEEDVESYEGPCVFAIPGNHDWFDGLVTYTRFVLGRDWLGGWLIPHDRSYFALKLRCGWWLFATDLGLAADIDLDQFKFFADIAASMNETDSVIIVTHEPHWVLDSEYNAKELAEENLRELMDAHLRGKVRLRLAGDLHHYTRHSPIFSSLSPMSNAKRSVSLSDKEPNKHDHVASANDPELIVSGGGGAFLHGTHTFHKFIDVGESQQKYKRVSAYPDEKTSMGLGWVNILHFRFRNWRLDIIWALASFGIASSLFPLCGIYENYLEQAHDQGPLALFSWLMSTMTSLFLEILLSGRVSLFFTVAVTLSLYALTDTKPKPLIHLLISLGHAALHIIVSLFCLVLIECLVEWLVVDGIVKIASSLSKRRGKWNPEPLIHGDGMSDLASCLYDEYMTHWSGAIANFTGNLTGHVNNMTSSASSIHDESTMGQMNVLERLSAYLFGTGADVFAWLFRLPVLSSTLYVFDLPGLVATKHYKICEVLCADGAECMISTDLTKFLLIDRKTLVVYLCAVFLYFAIMAVPTAGGVFGTWLAIMLNVFKNQYNEGFSSLRIPHWKNFLKIHIDDGGDLEVFCIGLHRVPLRWKRDPEWSEVGDRDNLTKGMPSWRQKKPSKWIPLNGESKKFQPEIVDHVRISKRSSRQSPANGGTGPKKLRRVSSC